MASLVNPGALHAKQEKLFSVLRALERLGVDADPASALALAERWRPYRSSHSRG